MSRVQYFWNRLAKMDWKALLETLKLLKKRSGKNRLWLLCDMLRCGIKYNAGYVDYKIAQMYRLNDAQRRTVITRGISNDIVRRMNPKEYWHTFDDKAEFNEFFSEWIPRRWVRIDDRTDPEEVFALCRSFRQLIGKPLEGSSGVGIRKYTEEDWKDGPAAFLEKLGVTRVVPARELSLAEIRKIREHTKLEIECFVPDKTKAGGEYVFKEGEVVKILPVQKKLVLGDGTEIRIEDISDISGELFAGEF